MLPKNVNTAKIANHAIPQPKKPFAASSKSSDLIRPAPKAIKPEGKRQSRISLRLTVNVMYKPAITMITPIIMRIVCPL